MRSLVQLVAVSLLVIPTLVLADNVRFLDNGDGTLTDTITGHIWLKDGGCLGKHSLEDAKLLIDSFNTDPYSFSCEGYTPQGDEQWELPPVNDLEGLVDSSVTDTSQWLNGVGFVNVQSGEYWSATLYSFKAGYGWYVMFNHASKPAAGHSYYARNVLLYRHVGQPTK